MNLSLYIIALHYNYIIFTIFWPTYWKFSSSNNLTLFSTIFYIFCVRLLIYIETRSYHFLSVRFNHITIRIKLPPSLTVILLIGKGFDHGLTPHLPCSNPDHCQARLVVYTFIIEPCPGLMVYVMI